MQKEPRQTLINPPASRTPRGGPARDWPIALAMAMLLLALKAPSLNLPLHWDEMGAYVRPAIDFAQGGLAHVLLGFRPGEAFFGHPPVLYVSLAAAFAIFGASPLVAHLYALAWAFLTLWYTYLLARDLHSRSAGLIAAALLLAMPVFFAQVGLVNGDTPIAALGLMTAYYALRRRYSLSILFASLAVLTKETALALAVATAIYVLVFQGDSSSARKLRWRPALRYLVPLILLLGFYLWQKVATGRWVANPYFDDAHHTMRTGLMAIANHGKWVIQWTLASQNRVVLLALLVAASLARSCTLRRREYLLFALYGVLFLAPFAAIFFMRRYIVPVLPYFSVLGAIAIASLVPGRWRRLALTALVAAAFLAWLHPRDPGYITFDYDLQYTDMIAIHREAADYLQANHPEARIEADWPLDLYLTRPEFGYVSRPLEVLPIDAGGQLRFWAPNEDLYPHPAPNSDAGPWRLLRRFERHGKYLLLYGRVD